jgi:HEPN domain-containing protein
MKPHEEWLFKADHDLKSAEYLAGSPSDLYDSAIYHTQQCAEKALKAFLAFNELPIEKSHNLIYLCQTALGINAEFTSLLDLAILLNPYATIFRYPEGDLLPTEEELQTAIRAARSVLSFVIERISL